MSYKTNVFRILLPTGIAIVPKSIQFLKKQNVWITLS